MATEFNVESLRRLGPYGYCDSLAPGTTEKYKTLIIFHGFAWHGGVFTRMLPFAAANNARIVIVNRRDYPGSESYDAREKDLLMKASGIGEFARRRAKDVFHFVSEFVRKEAIEEESVVLAGWSFGSVWILSFLAHVAAIAEDEDFRLDQYVRKVVAYDPPYHSLGYPPPKPFYNPLHDYTLPPGEGARLFPAWVSGYYRHGDSAAELEHRKTLAEPKPTITTMSENDVRGALFPTPAQPGGSDSMLMENGIACGFFEGLRERALYIPDIPVSFTTDESASTADPDNETQVEATVSKTDAWNAMELRYIWCDMSVWEMPWGTWALSKEIEHAKARGRKMRKISVRRVRGANHFAHWDHPDVTLKALLADDQKEMTVDVVKAQPDIHTHS